MYQVPLTIQAPGHLFGKILVLAVVHDDACALAGQFGGYRGPDATRCACYQANFTLEPTTHFSSTSLSGSIRTTM